MVHNSHVLVQSQIIRCLHWPFQVVGMHIFVETGYPGITETECLQNKRCCHDNTIVRISYCIHNHKLIQKKVPFYRLYLPHIGDL